MSSLRRYSREVPFRRTRLSTLRPDDVPILMIEFVSLDHDSRFREGPGDGKTLAYRVTHGELWRCAGHTPPQRRRQKEWVSAHGSDLKLNSTSAYGCGESDRSPS